MSSCRPGLLGFRGVPFAFESPRLFWQKSRLSGPCGIEASMLQHDARLLRLNSGLISAARGLGFLPQLCTVRALRSILS